MLTSCQDSLLWALYLLPHLLFKAALWDRTCFIFTLQMRKLRYTDVKYSPQVTVLGSSEAGIWYEAGQPPESLILLSMPLCQVLWQGKMTEPQQGPLKRKGVMWIHDPESVLRPMGLHRDKVIWAQEMPQDPGTLEKHLEETAAQHVRTRTKVWNAPQIVAGMEI